MLYQPPHFRFAPEIAEAPAVAEALSVCPTSRYEALWGGVGEEIRSADAAAIGKDWAFASRHELDTVLAGVPVALEQSGLEYAIRPRARVLQDYLLCNLLPIDSRFAPDDQQSGLSVRGSLLCLEDHRRTLAFVAAVRAAVAQLELQVEQGKEIFVVDAGCGAAPLLGLYAALSSPRVRVLALEVNPASARLARAVVHKFGLSERMEVRLRDARTLKLDHSIDLLVSDTLHTGLCKEPLVGVLENLVPYLADHGICIPRAVTVRAGLARERDFVNPSSFVHIAEQALRAFEVGWQSDHIYQAGDRVDRINLRVDAGSCGPGRYVAVVGSIVDLGFGPPLQGYDSLITHPYPVIRSAAFYDKNSVVVVRNGAEHGSARANISYKPGEIPVLA